MSQGIIRKFGSVLGFDDSDDYESMMGPVAITRPQFKITVYTPKEFDDVKQLADSLMSRSAVLIHFDKVDSNMRRRIIDYMNGVGYAVNAQVEKVSESIILYVPDNSVIEKEVLIKTKSNRWF